jgi:hypothetical protein
LICNENHAIILFPPAILLHPVFQYLICKKTQSLSLTLHSLITSCVTWNMSWHGKPSRKPPLPFQVNCHPYLLLPCDWLLDLNSEVRAYCLEEWSI